MPVPLPPPLAAVPLAAVPLRDAGMATVGWWRDDGGRGEAGGVGDTEGGVGGGGAGGSLQRDTPAVGSHVICTAKGTATCSCISACIENAMMNKVSSTDSHYNSSTPEYTVWHSVSPRPYTVRTALTLLYSSSFAARMSSEAPFPNASSMAASLLTSEARMGVREVPSRDSSPCVKAAADVCGREGQGEGQTQCVGKRGALQGQQTLGEGGSGRLRGGRGGGRGRTRLRCMGTCEGLQIL